MRVTYVVVGAWVSKRAEASAALRRRVGRTIRLRRLAGRLLREGRRRGRGSPGVRLLRYHAFMMVLLNDIVRIVAEALGFRKCIDQRLGLDSKQPLFKTLVQETVARFGDDSVGDSIEISDREVVDELLPRLGDHLSPKVSYCTPGNGRQRMVDRGVELKTG